MPSTPPSVWTAASTAPAPPSAASVWTYVVSPLSDCAVRDPRRLTAHAPGSAPCPCGSSEGWRASRRPSPSRASWAMRRRRPTSASSRSRGRRCASAMRTSITRHGERRALPSSSCPASPRPRWPSRRRLPVWRPKAMSSTRLTCRVWDTPEADAPPTWPIRRGSCTTGRPSSASRNPSS